MFVARCGLVSRGWARKRDYVVYDCLQQITSRHDCMIKCLNFTLEVTRNVEPFLSVGHRHGSVYKHRQKSGNGIREAKKISRSGAEKIMGRGGRKGSSWNWLQTTFLFPGTRSRLSRFFITNCFLLDARFAFWGRNALLSKFSLPRLVRVGFEAKGKLVKRWEKFAEFCLEFPWKFLQRDLLYFPLHNFNRFNNRALCSLYCYTANVTEREIFPPNNQQLPSTLC